jgi:uncharacterized protein (DUF2147 family)
MKRVGLASAIVGLIAMISPAWADSLEDMIGTWEWEGFTIDVSACGGSVCATVVDGPANVGEDMFLTEPEASGDGWNVEVMHPATGDTYFAHFTLDGDVWSMEGCTSSGVCAQGDFYRI